MENSKSIVEKLIDKSQEAFIVAIELYNKPTIKYRVEGFSFFICNAWELMLKAYLIKTKGNASIYYKDNPNRTITLENCIRLVFTNNKDPLRINLEKIIALRNTSTHFITEEYEQIYIPLFQACVLNYTNKLVDFFEIDITEQLNANFSPLSMKVTNIDETDIKARYPKEIAEKIINSFSDINKAIPEVDNLNFAITIRHDFVLTKNKKEATAAFTLTKDAKQAAYIFKETKDMQLSCPYTVSKCVDIINKWIQRDKLNFINPSNDENKQHTFTKYHFDLFVKFYDIKNNPRFCYEYNRSKANYYSYSNSALEFIYSEIKKDPEHIIQSLKKSLKNK